MKDVISECEECGKKKYGKYYEPCICCDKKIHTNDDFIRFQNEYMDYSDSMGWDEKYCSLECFRESTTYDMLNSETDVTLTMSNNIFKQLTGIEKPKVK